jgi:hypothetical protein
VLIVVSVYFVIDTVQQLLDTPSYTDNGGAGILHFVNIHWNRRSSIELLITLNNSNHVALPPVRFRNKRILPYIIFLHI